MVLALRAARYPGNRFVSFVACAGARTQDQRKDFVRRVRDSPPTPLATMDLFLAFGFWILDFGFWLVLF